MLQSEVNKNTHQDPARVPDVGPQPDKPKGLDRDSRDRGLSWNRMDFTEEHIGFLGGPQRRSGFKLALWMWASVCVDILILVASSCFFLIAFLLLEKASASKLLGLIVSEQNLMFAMLGLLALAGWCYFVTMRVFVGASFGEWSCSLRLGQPFERRKKDYVLKVMLRTFFIIATGVVILPLLSLIFRKDLAGKLSGLFIYTLK